MKRTIVFALLVTVTVSSALLALPQTLAVHKQNPGATTCTVTGTNPGGHTLTKTFRGPNAVNTARHVHEGWLNAHWTGVTNSCA